MHAVGLGSRSSGSQIGPCITGMIPVVREGKGKKKGRDKHLLIEDGVIPGALGPMLPAAFRLASEVIGKEPPIRRKLTNAILAASAA